MWEGMCHFLPVGMCLYEIRGVRTAVDPELFRSKLESICHQYCAQVDPEATNEQDPTTEVEYPGTRSLEVVVVTRRPSDNTHRARF